MPEGPTTHSTATAVRAVMPSGEESVAPQNPSTLHSPSASASYTSAGLPTLPDGMQSKY